MIPKTFLKLCPATMYHRWNFSLAYQETDTKIRSLNQTPAVRSTLGSYFDKLKIVGIWRNAST
jgi:hypothetical protein